MQTNETNSLEICTKFILGFFFGEVEYSTIALLKDNSKDAFDIEDAIEVFKNYQLSSTIREMYVKDIPAHFLPSIIISPADEALVLLEIKADNAIVLNPIKNTQEEIPLKNFKKNSKILLIFRSKNEEEFLESKSSKTWFSTPLRASWRTYVEVGILTLFINIFALAIPLFVMSTYDRVIPNKAYATLFVLALGALIILIFDIILKYARNHILEDFSKKIGLFWEEELMRKMILANAHFDHFTTGTKANLFKELHHVRDFFTIRSLMQVIDLPFFFIALLVIYIISPTMAAVPFIFSILIIGFNILMQLPIAKLGANNSQNIQSKEPLADSCKQPII